MDLIKQTVVNEIEFRKQALKNCWADVADVSNQQQVGLITHSEAMNTIELRFIAIKENLQEIGNLAVVWMEVK